MEDEGFVYFGFVKSSTTKNLFDSIGEIYTWLKDNNVSDYEVRIDAFKQGYIRVNKENRVLFKLRWDNEK